MSCSALATYVRRQYPRAIDSWMQSPLRQDKKICLDLKKANKETNKPLSVLQSFSVTFTVSEKMESHETSQYFK